MQIAVVKEWGSAPVLEEAERPPVPTADSDQIQVKVTAVGIHQLVRSRALGKHYSTKTLPHVPGTDAAGELADGKKVWLSGMDISGTLKQYINVAKRDVFEAPANADAAKLAAFVNPAFSSWMALSHRAKDLPKGFTVLILGATTASGILAAQFSRRFGASRVIGCARDEETLAKLDLDDTITLKGSVKDTDFSKANDADVIFDYLFGPPAQHLLTTIKPSNPVQYIQIGSLAGPEIPFKSDILRSKDITMIGSGFGSWSKKALASEVPAIIEALTQINSPSVHTVSLQDIEATWDHAGKQRLVYLL